MAPSVRRAIRILWPIAFVALIGGAALASIGILSTASAFSSLVPLGLFGLYRWSMWLARKIPAAFYAPYGGDHTATASIIVPVYREDPEIFRRAIESWLANDPDEVLLVIDSTDEACIAVAGEFPSLRVLITDVPGKRPALALGIAEATCEIVVLVDSDTIWEPGVLASIYRPFADPKIGGVGTRQNVYRPESIWQKLADIYLDIRYADEAPAYTVVGRAVSCLSGRTAAYRREILVPALGDFLDERFIGQLCMSGEDKRLTSLVLKAGYQTYHQDDAQVWSTFPADYRTTVAQRTRWARNSFRSDLRAFWEGWILRHPYLAIMLLDRMISPFALLVALAYGIAALVTGQWLVAVVLGMWWLVSRAVKMIPHLVRRPRDLIVLPAFVVMNFGMAVLKIRALITVHHHKWLTRPVEVIDGQIVRIDPSTERRVDHPPLRARLAGTGVALSLFVAVQFLLLGFGGAGYLPRADTTRPEVAAAVPATVPAGSPIPAGVVVTGEDDSSGLSYVWTLQGAYLGSAPDVMLPSDLAPGRYVWAVYVRDGAGNTTSRDGVVVVTGGSEASSEAAAP